VGVGFLLAGRLGQEVAGDARVLAGGAVGDAEHQGQVQRVRPAGQCLVQDPVAADALDADAVGLEVEVDVALADGRVPEGGPVRDQDVPVESVRPGGAAVVQPRPQRLLAEVADPLGVAGDGDAPVGQVQVVQRECADRLPTGGVDGGQGDDQPLPRVGDGLLDRPDLVVAQWQQAGLRAGGLQPLGGVGQDQAALLGEPELRPERRDRGAELPSAELAQLGPVVRGNLPKMSSAG
jgi:hypothetical protein